MHELSAPEPPRRNGTATLSTLELHLRVHDPSSVAALVLKVEGSDRNEHALAALRIGLLAIEQANGQIDAGTIRREGERLVELLSGELRAHGERTNDRVRTALAEYLDPNSGRFPEHMRALLADDGQIQRVLRSAVDGDASLLSRTLAEHIGSQSPLMRRLDPESREGLLEAIRVAVNELTEAQRAVFLRELSLDVDDSALRRFLRELEERQGSLEEALEQRVDLLTAELSLDREDSALSRLVGQVDRASRTIGAQLTLDDERSALSRLHRQLEDTGQVIREQLTLDDQASALSVLRRELFEVLERHEKRTSQFQDEVKKAVQELTARKAAQQGSTLHGHSFEDRLLEQLGRRAQRHGDLIELTGSRPGVVRHCKKGDAVIELGPDHVAAGAKIVVEAKENKSYGLREAHAELEEARRNREACVGLFVFSRTSAPDAIEPLFRCGDDVFCVWDADDPGTDVVLDAALMVARWIAVAQTVDTDHEADLASLDASVNAIERHAGQLGDVQKWAGTIQRNAEKILERVEKDRAGLEAQVEALREGLTALRAG